MNEKNGIDALLGPFRSDDAFHAIVEFFGGRQRDPHHAQTKVSNLKYDLSLRHYRFTEADLVSAFRVLEQAGYVKVNGTRSNAADAIVHWQTSAKRLAQDVLGRAKQQSSPPPVGALVDIESTSNAATETFQFPVRRGVYLGVTIRDDMTANELNNLADFIRVIAASRSIPAAGKSNLTSC